MMKVAPSPQTPARAGNENATVPSGAAATRAARFSAVWAGVVQAPTRATMNSVDKRGMKASSKRVSVGWTQSRRRGLRGRRRRIGYAITPEKFEDHATLSTTPGRGRIQSILREVHRARVGRRLRRAARAAGRRDALG